MFRMRILAFLMALAITVNISAPAQASELIASVKADNEYYTVAGEVITIWYDSLLLGDGTGQMVVSVAPAKVEELKIDSRNTITVTGKLKAGAFYPLVILNNTTGENFEFTPEEMTAIYPVIDPSELSENMQRYRR